MNKLVLIGLLGFCLTSLAQTPIMQTLTGEATVTCPQDNTLTLQGSEVGFNYYLRNEFDDSIVDGPIAGTGSALDFQTGVVSETSSYHVVVANPSYALDFDGINDYVEIPHDDSLNFSTGVTVEAWVHPTNITNGYQEIYRKEGTDAVGRILFSFQNNGTILSFGTHTTTDLYTELDVAINPTDYNNQWVHILAFFDDATNAMRIFRNGVEIGNKSSIGTLVNSANPQAGYIGSWNGTTEYFQGKIASLRLWDKALTTQQEIDQAMDNVFVGNEDGLVAYYPFNENTGTVLNDLTSNENDGSIEDATWEEVFIGNEAQFTVSNTQSITISPVMDELYVDKNATGNNDGTSWADAYTTITQATDFINNKCLPNENDVIHIAQGTYKEGAEVTIQHPITIKGGYPTGGGTQEIDNNPTIIDGNQTHRVLKATHTTGTMYLEGLTIQYGRTEAVTGISTPFGSGIFTAGDLDLNFLQVNNNSGFGINSGIVASGGGIFTVSGNITLSESQVKHNTLFGDTTAGGGIRTGSGNITLTNSRVSNNITTSLVHSSSGGGIYTNSGIVTLNNSRVSNNAIASLNNKSLGGGVYTLEGVITLINSGINNNTTLAELESSGGGIYMGTGSAKLTNSLLANNTSYSKMDSSHGGGVFAESGSLTLINSRVSQNRVTNNDLFVPASGGGVYGAATIQNTILWGNNKSSDNGGTYTSSEHDNGILTANYSVIKDVDLTGQGMGNINANVANFEANNFIDVASGNFGLLPTSVLIDDGNDVAYPDDAPDTDLAGNPRTIGPIDIGPLESADFTPKNYATAANAYYFNIDSQAQNQDGLSWATAFDNLNDYFYIGDKSNISEIYLATGVYKTTGALDFNTEVQVHGGFNATTNISEVTEKSTIDVQQNSRVIYTTENITLDQIIIKNGNHHILDSVANGGGLFASKNISLNKSQVINNSVSSSHSTEASSSTPRSQGGGVYSETGYITINASEISNNELSSNSSASSIFFSQSLSNGGGVYSNSAISLTNSIVSNNTASSNSSSTSFSDSLSRSHGGGVYTNNGSIMLTNSLVYKNTAYSTSSITSDSKGGGVFAGAGSITITNSQVSNNALSSIAIFPAGNADAAGGVYGGASLNNSILWGNREYERTNGVVQGDGFNEHENSTLTTSHSLVKGRDLSATNGIDATVMGFDPLFFNEATGDYRLQSGSPLIDAGDDMLLPFDDYDIDGDGDFMELLPLDLDGYARDVGFNVDIGPYEYGDLIFKGGFE